MIFKLISKLMPYKVVNAIDRRFDNIYSLWLANEFRSVGRNFHVKRMLRLQGGRHIKIGDNFHCDVRLRLEAWDNHLGYSFNPEIVIGNNVGINLDCHISAINRIEIGDNVLIASKVFITDHFHGSIEKEAIAIAPAKRQLYSKGPVVVEENVWIGEGVVIMPNVRVGSNSIIGANSVVTKDIPMNVVVGGNPAKVIRLL